jgi:hypothetical protein
VTRFVASEQWHRGYPADVLHITDNSVPAEVYLFQTPSKSVGGLQWYSAYLNDSWRMRGRITLNLGLRFERFRAFLPAQERPPGQSGERSWSRQVFDAVDNLIDWNVVAPRVGVNHDLAGDGRTVVKASYAKYWIPPFTEVLFNANPNSKEWLERFTWIDVNSNGRWDTGEDVQLQERRGGQEIESLDPDLKLSFVREATLRIARELVPNIKVETAVVWRGARQPFLRQPELQPFGAFTRAVSAIDPGVDGFVGTPDDASIVVYDLPEQPASLSYQVRNVPDAPSDSVTWEVTTERRLSRRWSLVAGASQTWMREQASTYLGQQMRNNTYPLTPNDLINTSADGRHEFRVWSARAYGTYEGPWRLRITPFLRHQSGHPYGRTFQVRNLNLGSLRVLAEPIGTRRTDHITLFDVRVEKIFPLGGSRRASSFVDVFNLFNANPEQNINWSSAGFGRPLTIVPPRVARIGVKLAW